MIFTDSNVFIIDLRYKRDPLYKINRNFLTRIAKIEKGAVTLVNLLEVAGVLSYNLSRPQLAELLVHFPRRYGVKILPPLGDDDLLKKVSVEKIVEIISKKCSFGDALVIDQVERLAYPDSVFVTWDAKHFEGKISVPVITPKQFLKDNKSDDQLH